MQKVLFLDFDGPLFSDRGIQFLPNDKIDIHLFRRICEDNGDNPNLVTYARMDPVAVSMLNKLYEKHHFTTVISSTWRTLFCKWSIQSLLEEINGLELPLHNTWCTDSLIKNLSGGLYESRSSQILRWLEANPEYLDNYVVLDDPLSGPDLDSGLILNKANVVMVDPTIGMELTHFYKLDRLLGAN